MKSVYVLGTSNYLVLSIIMTNKSGDKNLDFPTYGINIFRSSVVCKGFKRKIRFTGINEYLIIYTIFYVDYQYKVCKFWQIMHMINLYGLRSY